VGDLLEAQAAIDVKKLEASYSIVQFFIWAIPIWGFIGTVLGIADAVQEFSNFIQTAETGVQFTTQMRSALGGVTSGLAVAFNTTFLALVLVMPVMLITSMLQKAEEELRKTWDRRPSRTTCTASSKCPTPGSGAWSRP
jgi:biopolymer transport protein ExbB/TolQ